MCVCACLLESKSVGKGKRLSECVCELVRKCVCRGVRMRERERCSFDDEG